MTKPERLHGIRRQLDLLGYRADRLNPGPRRDTLVAKMERLTPAYPARSRLGFLTLNPNSTSRTFPVRLVPL
jgi:hypothetical protein